MFDATKLLGELMGSQATPSAAGRLNSAMTQTGMAPAGTPPAEGGALGSLQSLLGGLGGGGAGAGAAGGGLGGLLGQLMGGVQSAAGTARTEVEANNPMAIGGLGALAGALLGGGKGAVGGGLMAVLGSFAVNALQNSGHAAPAAATALPTAPLSGAPVQAAPVMTASLPTTHEDVQANARLLLRAMISAAKADGQIDAQEMNKIMGKLGETGSDPAAQQFMFQEMGKPLDLPGLAAEARTPELAVQVYAASLMAIEVDTPSEERYLASLAQALRLPPTTVTQIHRAMGLSA